MCVCACTYMYERVRICQTCKCTACLHVLQAQCVHAASSGVGTRCVCVCVACVQVHRTCIQLDGHAHPEVNLMWRYSCVL